MVPTSDSDPDSDADAEGSLEDRIHGSAGEVNGFAGKDGDIEMGLGHTHCHRVPDVLDEITEPSQADLSPSDSPPTVESSRQSQLLRELHEKEKDNPSREHSLDCDPDEPNRVLNMPSTDGDIETGGTPSSVHVQGGPLLQQDSSSQGAGHEDSNIQTGGLHSSGRVHNDPRLGDLCSYHNAPEDNWERLTTMVDPLLGVIIQSACSLVAYKKSDGSSIGKDVLFYLIVAVDVLSFLVALAGKWFRCYKMGGIGLLAAALGFLMTMALVVIYKIG
ncbi:hypothetical protein EUGRSUZ_L01727 [Eucalyptus grandis]|uniref:Transmembrane protein n=1 Tax=Eucalyptus grandis TaxID=71139 RepID=A0A058ZSF1_EUCGR|nr:hypothetical protein EUGRSUZ_L01727 [Eucalyptus grandis]